MLLKIFQVASIMLAKIENYLQFVHSAQVFRLIEKLVSRWQPCLQKSL